MATVIGIDFGTTNSCVSVLRNDVPEVIANEVGNRVTPSCIAFADDEILVGEPAQRQAYENPNSTVYDIKKLVGVKYDDPVVQSMIKEVPFTIIKGKNNEPVLEIKIKGKNKTYSVTELITIIFEKMKTVAAGYLGQECKHCVLSVPALATKEQRQIYTAAAKMAKLEVLKLVTEPAAAAIAYGLDEDSKESNNVLVFDVGGNTCDVSVIRTAEGMLMLKQTSTCANMGGDTFDSQIVKHFASEFERKNKVVLQGPEGDKTSMKKLNAACQRAKKILARENSANVECESLYKGKDLFTSLTRARMEQLIGTLTGKCTDAVKNAFADAEASDSLAPTDYTHLILAGGSSQICKLRESVIGLVPKAKVLDSIQPEEVVAYGCALQASVLQGATPAQDKDYSIPTVASSISIEAAEGVAEVVVVKGTPLPCSKTVTVTGATAEQKDIFLQVYEGERMLCENNALVAQFKIGAAAASLSFTVGADGALSITPSTGGGKTIAVAASSADTGTVPTPTQQERKWDKAMLSWIKKKADATAYVKSIMDGMVSTGTLKSMDPSDTVGAMCTAITAYITADVAEDADSVNNAVNQLSSKQDALAALVAQVLTSGAKGEAKKEESESEDDEGDDESEEESEDEALD